MTPALRYLSAIVVVSLIVSASAATPTLRLAQPVIAAGETAVFTLSPGRSPTLPTQVDVIDRSSGKTVASVPVPKNSPGVLPQLPPGSYRLQIDASPGKPAYLGVLPARETPPRDSFFLINDHRYLAADFNAYSRYGFTWKRDIVSRETVQRAPDRFDWSALSERLESLRQSNQRGSLIVAYSPEWDRPRSRKKSQHSAPVDKEAFSRYVHEASRVCPVELVPVFEIWNEPNTADFFHGTVEEYAGILKRAYTAAKSATPLRIVHMGGLAGFDWHFLERLEQTGALAYTDAIALHPYLWGESDLWLWEQLGRLSRWRDRVAPGQPLSLNEWGIEADGDRPEQLRIQAEKLVRQTTLIKAAGAAVSGYYLWTQGRQRLLEHDGAPRPAGIAQYVLAGHLSGARYLGRLPLHEPKDFAFCFERNGSHFLIAWTSGAKASLPPEVLTTASRVTDIFGRPLPAGDGIPLALTASPLFVENPSVSTLSALTPPGFTDQQTRLVSRESRNGWIDFQYPSGTQTLPVSDNFRTIELTIHNTSTESLPCDIRFHTDPTFEIRPLHETPPTIPAGKEGTLRLKVRAAPFAEEETRTFAIDAILGEKSLPPFLIRTRYVDGNYWEFLANSYEDFQNRISGKNIKTAPHRLWTTGPEGEAIWRFDLTGSRSARVDAATSPRRPPESTFQFSHDGKTWVSLPFRTPDRASWDCSRFAGGPLYVRYASGPTPDAALHKLIVYANAGKTS